MIHVTTTTSTARASAFKEVSCEGCGAVYHYRHTAMGSGKAIGVAVLYIHDPFARDRANQAAERAASAKARKGFGVCACPRCNRLQKNMVPILRAQFLREYEVLGRFVPFVCGLASIGIALLTTNFFDEPLRGLPALWVGVTSIAAIFFFIQFGAKLWFTARAFDVDHFGPSSIPVGIEGPAEIISPDTIE